MIPLFVGYPESVVKVRAITTKDKLERTVKTLHKAGALHIEVNQELEALVLTSVEKEPHSICDPLTPIDSIFIYVQTGKYTYLESNIKPIYSRSFRESDLTNGSVAVNWN